MNLTASQKQLLSREGLTGASPERIHEHADRYIDAGKHDQAHALSEIAFDLEQDAGTPAPHELGDPDGPSKHPAAKRAAKSSRRGSSSKKKRRSSSRWRSQKRQAADATVGVITPGELVWSIVSMTVVLVLVYTIVTKSDRIVLLLQDGTKAFTGLVYPKAFRETEAAEAAAAGAADAAARAARGNSSTPAVARPRTSPRRPRQTLV